MTGQAPARGRGRRLFWTDDQRFLKQFRAGSLSARFKPYSKFPPCFKDVSFWTNDRFTENNLCEIVRGIAGARIAGGKHCARQHGCRCCLFSNPSTAAACRTSALKFQGAGGDERIIAGADQVLCSLRPVQSLARFLTIEQLTMATEVGVLVPGADRLIVLAGVAGVLVPGC